jgi:ABC-type Zn uptake system ZnuABC Zn-binding protein ZnuA
LVEFGGPIAFTADRFGRLGDLDPAGAADYRALAVACIQQILAVDAWARRQMSAVPAAKRRALSSHDSLQYIANANAYSITPLSRNGWTNKSEPSAAELAKLAQRIRDDRVRAVFLDSSTDPRAMRRLAEETGAEIGGMIYGDALSPKGGEADTDLAMLRDDISTLQAGMLQN